MVRTWIPIPTQTSFLPNVEIIFWVCLQLLYKGAFKRRALKANEKVLIIIEKVEPRLETQEYILHAVVMIMQMLDNK